MNRRRLMLTSMTAATALSAPAIAQSQPALRWRMQSAIPRRLDSLYEPISNFTKRVAEATDNRFTIQLFGPGDIVGALQSGDAVAAGTIEAAATAAGYWVGRDVAYSAYTQMILGLNARQINAWAYQSGGVDLFNRLFEREGVFVLPICNAGSLMAGWFRKEITSVTDLRGLKVRLGGMTAQVLQRLGVVGQQIAIADTFSALERGVIDGARFSSPADEVQLGFARIAPNYYYPGWLEGAGLLQLFINLERWRQLPVSYQSLIRTSAMASTSEALARYDAANPAALRTLVAQGARIRPLSAEVLEAVAREANAHYMELSAQNEGFRSIWESMREFRVGSAAWTIVDLSFDAAMARLTR